MTSLDRAAGLLVLACLVLAGLAIAQTNGLLLSESADKETADWTRILAIVTAIGLLVQLSFIWRADRTAAVAAAAARDSAKGTLDANRPWLNFDIKLAGPLQAEGDRAQILCEVIIENLGNSPAIWTSIIAFVDHLAQDSDYELVGLRGASVFQGKRISRKQMAPLLDLHTKGLFHESHLVLRVRIEYPLPGTTKLGSTTKCWQLLGPFLGGINLGKRPIDHREQLHLRPIEESDVAS